jgi:hypothetical protein
VRSADYNEGRRDALPWDDEYVTIPVRVSWPQYREINRRAGIRVSGRARSVFIVGTVFDEAQSELLERVRQIATEDRDRFRAELTADRARRAERLHDHERADVEVAVQRKETA